MTSKNGSAFTWPKKPHKITQIKIHFKNIGETVPAIEGMHIWKATEYLEDVTLQKQCVPFHCYSGGAGRCAKDKHWGWRQGRRPKNSAEFLLHMLKNAEGDAELKDLDVDYLAYWAQPGEQNPTVGHRTYRAQGWNNPSMSSPCHTEMILSEKEQTVPKPEEEVAQKKKIPRRNWRNKNLRYRNKYCKK